MKDLSKNKALENFTTVYAMEQYAGRGQMNTHWCSEAGKNLLCTIYVDFKGIDITHLSYINKLIAVKLAEVIDLLSKENAKVSVKWPNDILSGHHKLAGVLIENIIKQGQIEECFIGIGLNVNQIIFPNHLSKATSLKQITAEDYDIEVVLRNVIKALEPCLNKFYIQNNPSEVQEAYLKVLYRYQLPAMYQKGEDRFMGKILNVDEVGNLVLELEDGQIKKYEIKEIKFL